MVIALAIAIITIATLIVVSYGVKADPLYNSLRDGDDFNINVTDITNTELWGTGSTGANGFNAVNGSLIKPNTDQEAIVFNRHTNFNNTVTANFTVKGTYSGEINTGIFTRGLNNINSQVKNSVVRAFWSNSTWGWVITEVSGAVTNTLCYGITNPSPETGYVRVMLNVTNDNYTFTVNGTTIYDTITLGNTSLFYNHANSPGVSYEYSGLFAKSPNATFNDWRVWENISRAFEIDYVTGDELYDVYSRWENNSTYEGGWITAKGIDTFNSTIQSPQWSAVTYAYDVDHTSSLSYTGERVEIISSNDASPKNGYTYLWQNATWPNNATVESSKTDTTYFYGGISLQNESISLSNDYSNVNVYQIRENVQFNYRNLAGTIITLGSFDNHGYNISMSIERTSSKYILTAISLDDGYMETYNISIALVYETTSNTFVCIGDTGGVTGGGYIIGWAMDNFTLSNRSASSFATYHYNIPYRSFVKWVNISGNITDTNIWLGYGDNHTDINTNTFYNVTTNTTFLNEQLMGSILQFRIWMNSTTNYVSNITMGLMQRNETINMTVAGKSNHFTSIANAVNGTMDGDTIYVYPSWSYGKVYVKHNITIDGLDNETCRLNVTQFNGATTYTALHIIGSDFNVTIKKINISQPNTGIEHLYETLHDGYITVDGTRFYDCYYGLYVQHINGTIKNSAFIQDKPIGGWVTPQESTSKAMNLQWGNWTIHNNFIKLYAHGVYIRQGNGHVYDNYISCYDGGYWDQGGIIIYPWEQNGTTSIHGNYIYNASWGISLEDSDIVYIYDNTIHECNLAISIFQRDPGGVRWRLNWDDYGGYARVSNNLLIGDMATRGFNLYGDTFVELDGNRILHQNNTIATYNPTMRIFAKTNPQDSTWEKTGLFYINNTYIEDCGTGFRTDSGYSGFPSGSLPERWVGMLEVHINNMTIESPKSTETFAWFEANSTSTVRNLTINNASTNGIIIQSDMGSTIDKYTTNNVNYCINNQGPLFTKVYNSTFNNGIYGFYLNSDAFIVTNTNHDAWYQNWYNTTERNAIVWNPIMDNVTTPFTTIPTTAGDWYVPVYSGVFNRSSVESNEHYVVAHFGNRSTFKTVPGESLSFNYTYSTTTVLDPWTGLPTSTGESINYGLQTTSTSQQVWMLENVYFNGNIRNNVVSNASVTATSNILRNGEVHESGAIIEHTTNTTHISFNATSGEIYTIGIFAFPDDMFSIIPDFANLGTGYISVLICLPLTLLFLMFISAPVVLIYGAIGNSTKKYVKSRRKPQRRRYH